MFVEMELEAAGMTEGTAETWVDDPTPPLELDLACPSRSAGSAEIPQRKALVFVVRNFTYRALISCARGIKCAFGHS